MFSPVLIELLLGLASEGAFGARVRPFASVVHLVLLQLPFGTKYFGTYPTLFRVLGIVYLQVQFQRSVLFETLITLGTLVHPIPVWGVHLKVKEHLDAEVRGTEGRVSLYVLSKD